MTAPCKGCEDRKVGCHATCEKYKAYRAVKEAEYAWRMEQRRADEALDEGMKRCSKQWNKKLRKRYT